MKSVVKSVDRDNWQEFKTVVGRTYLFLASIGLAAFLVALLGHAVGAIDVQLADAKIETAWAVCATVALWAWENASGIVKAITALMFAYALLLASLKIQTVFNIVRTFNEARSPITELRSAVIDMPDSSSGFQESLDGIKTAAHELKDHAPMLRELNEKLEAIMKKINRLEEDQISQRTSESDIASSDGVFDDTENWEELRGIWRRNNDRMERIIASRLKGARRTAFDNLSRSDWPGIMERLVKLSALGRVEFEKSVELHRLFMSHKSRRKTVRDETVAAARVLDAQLAGLLEPILIDGDNTQATGAENLSVERDSPTRLPVGNAGAEIDDRVSAGP